MTFGGPLTQEQLNQLKLDAEQALDRFEIQARATGVSYERRYSDDDTESGLVQQAHYADLVVLSQTDPALSGMAAVSQLPEYVALHGGRPVLLAPYAGAFTGLGQHALVAWDGSRAATRAVTDALPLLCASRRVTLAVFTPRQPDGAHGDEPGADIAGYLARHGVKVEVLQQRLAHHEAVGDALLSLAAERSADLLVTGCYGHQRWRELVLGGVTRHVLQAMTLPVLMAH
jgi:nucleotide-binding universal stress UspA family protein